MNASAAPPLLAAVRALRPAIVEAAPSIEASGRLPPALVDALSRAGMFRAAVPREYGGDEVDPLVVFEALEDIATADASVAWVCLIISANPLLFAQALDPVVWRTLYAHGPDTRSAGSIAPAGRATPVDGGWRVSGHWKYGSGSADCEYLVSGALAWDADGPRHGPDGAPEIFWFVHPVSDCRLVPGSWNSTGLRGSGSVDYLMEDAFVPHAWTLHLGARVHPLANPMYRFPTLPFCQLAGITLGLARAALDHVLGLAASKRRGPVAMRDDPGVQIRVAEAEARLGSARAWIVGVVADLLATLRSGAEPSPAQRARFRLASTWAVDAAVDVVDAMVKVAGGDAIAAGSHLDRIFRDIHTAQTHIQMNDHTYVKAGRLLLDLPAGDPLF